MRRILVVRHGAFGDNIVSQAAMEEIRCNFPLARIAVLSEPVYHKFWQRCPYVDEVIADKRAPLWRVDQILPLRAALRRFQPDCVFDLQNSERSARYRLLMLPNVPWSFVANAKSRDAVFPKSMPGIQRLYGQLTASGLATVKDRKPDIGWMTNDVTQILVDAEIRTPFVVLIPGCSAKHPQKRWPFYAQLAEALLESGVEVVTVPGPDEMELCRSIAGKMLTGERFLDWFDLAGVLNEAAFVVGNDTGPSHVAAHLNRPGLALFGPYGDPASTSIDTRSLEVIQAPDLAHLKTDTILSRVLVGLGRQIST